MVQHAVTSTTLNVGEVSFRFVEMPPGRFLMGSLRGLPYAPEDPVHEVRISARFALGQFPVTQAQYAAVMGHNPASFASHANAPVENVTWHDALHFCQQLSAAWGQNVRLPTESEWEFACRAGTNTEYFFGNDARILGDYGWFELNSAERTQPVGAKRPNPWGLHDLVGNVWEWCADVWHSDYSGAPADGSAWLTNQDQQGRRCVRGGAWNMDAFRCRSSYRSYDWSDAATSRLGFRIVLAAPP